MAKYEIILNDYLHKIMSEPSLSGFSGKVRVRACGVLVENEKILMIKHRGLGEKGYYWIPPGGGVESGQSAEHTITREFLEETGLEVEVSDFLFINEFIAHPLHAIELFFTVVKVGGEINLGSDPEMQPDEQIIEEVRFLSISDIEREGPAKVHTRFCGLTSFQELKGAKGFFNFKNNYLK